MKRLVLIGLLLGLLLCALTSTFKFSFTPNISVVKANPADIWVPYNYPTIQAAINAANSGDVIHVVGGPYARIVVNKTVSLVGEGEAIIDGEGIVQQGIVNITVNGVSIRNFIIRNAPEGYGIFLDGRTFCYLENNRIENVHYGILVDGTEKGSSNIYITGNNITNVYYGVSITNSSNNNILTNNIHAWWVGVQISLLGDSYYGINNLISNNNITGISTTEGIRIISPNNTICNNWVSNCDWGIHIEFSNNTIHHNNFINNTNQAYVHMSATNNKWNLDWPMGGNFWSSHSLTDIFNGEYQNQPGSDGICDTPYIVEGDDVDKYPLMGPCNRFEVLFGPYPPTKHEILVISNSSISTFQMNTTQRTISFNVSGDAGIGFCRVDIPNVIVGGLWPSGYTVLVNDQAPLYMRNWTSGTTTYIYFQYLHSTKEVIIVPEFQTALILLLMIFTTLIVIAKKCIKNTNTHFSLF
ncbi:MAG: NosD domain-containing protein [Candidatus Bathyarchaeia archaeon]